MATSEAQKRASKKYFDSHYRQVKLTMPVEEAEALTEYCERNNYTKQGLIRELIKERINQSKSQDKT